MSSIVVELAALVVPILNKLTDGKRLPFLLKQLYVDCFRLLPVTFCLGLAVIRQRIPDDFGVLDGER